MHRIVMRAGAAALALFAGAHQAAAAESIELTLSDTRERVRFELPDEWEVLETLKLDEHGVAGRTYAPPPPEDGVPRAHYSITFNPRMRATGEDAINRMAAAGRTLHTHQLKDCAKPVPLEALRSAVNGYPSVITLATCAQTVSDDAFKSGEAAYQTQTIFQHIQSTSGVYMNIWTSVRRLRQPGEAAESSDVPEGGMMVGADFIGKNFSICDPDKAEQHPCAN